MAGAGYKLFNTGDVLTAAQVNTYLMEQTVMVFADAAARTTALTGVVSEGMISYLKDTNAVEVYNGSAWVASDDPNAIQNTIVDAKGDLISATAADTPARLAVGNNGETVVADTSTTTGLRWQVPVNSNPVLNSAFQVWQRGTSISLSASSGVVFTADRWATSTNTNQACTVSRQATGDTTNLPNIQYSLRLQRNSGQTGTGLLLLTQSFETINSIPYVGRTVTVSFYARAGANYSSASNVLINYFMTGTGTDQNRQSGAYTGDVTSSNNATLTTTWQRFSYTYSVASTATEIAIGFAYTPVGTAGAADFFEVTGVQLEVGSVATPFKTYAGTLAGELAACQRYYYRTSASQVYTRIANGLGRSSTILSFIIPNPVEMRVSPTSIDSSTLIGFDGTNFTGAVSAVTLTTPGRLANEFEATVTGATQYRPYQLLTNNSTAGYVGFSAEL